MNLKLARKPHQRATALSLLKTSLIALLFLTSFSSCLSARKMDKWIDKHYKETAAGAGKKSDYISIKEESKPASLRLSTTTRGKKKLIPALFYWHWDYSTVSTLHSSVFVNSLNAGMVPYANSKGMRQKLDGKKLELSIVKAPASFELTEKGNLIYLIFYYIGWEHIYIEPRKEDLVVAYRILKDGLEVKRGELEIPNRDQSISLKMFQSPRKMTWRYLDQYGNNVKNMSKELVDRLIVEVQQQDGYARN